MSSRCTTLADIPYTVDHAAPTEIDSLTDNNSTSELPDFIPGVPPEHVAELADPGVIDIHTQRLVEAEASFLRSRRGSSSREGESPLLSGLAFSGGGVRSAAFALGVLQVLAGRRLLERFDYLSSVSGGGFVTGALVWFLGSISTVRFGTGPSDFPFGSEPRSDESSTTDVASMEGAGESSDARRNSASDTPPSTTKVAPAPDVAQTGALLNFLRQHGAYLTPGHGITLTSTIAVVLRGILLNLLVWLPIMVCLMMVLLAVPDFLDGEIGFVDGAPVAFDILLWFGIGLGLLFAFGSIAYSVSTHSRWSVRKQRYLWHRWYETRMPWILLPLLGVITLASLPWGANVSLGFVGRFGGAAFVAIGLAIGLWSFLRPDSSWGVSFIRKRALPIGALLALYGVLLFAYQTAFWLHVYGGLVAYLLSAVLLVLALLSGWCVNLNYIALQRYYRDRLMEAFMPDIDRALGQQGGPAAEADAQRLSTCLDFGRSDVPYPLFNTHIPLASAKSRRRRLRGGDNFILSPLYCGSSATGWRRTELFMNDGMTLPTAMAISGSVNHQQSGLGGVGIALNPLVSLLKVLLNLRMGYWVPNPRNDEQARRPNHFVPGLGEALGIGQDEDESFLLLEDGGYFDNLGIYELLRRRLQLILVCDAGADAGTWLSDLYQVLRLVEVDFGARVTFDNQADYLAVVPGKPAPYPEGGNLAECGHLLGQIEYADGTSGTLVYMKSVLVPGLNFSELGFGSRRTGFPQETTADQFFDEEQFDAHRRLGCELASRLIDEQDLESLLQMPGTM